MGWGISIGQDENGHVYCSDANWETYSDDYEDGDTVYPPSSYEFLRDYMDCNHRGEIDLMRDDGDLGMAHEECCSAFSCAKSAYDELSDAERTVMHREWLAATTEELSKIVVDEDAIKMARDKIHELNTQLDEIQLELRRHHNILKPSRRKAILDKQLVKEHDSWE